MTLNYKVFGSGEPLIILHGLLGSLDNWQSMAKKLSESFQVYIVDQRNHGKSPHVAEHSYETMQADLLEFVNTHKIEKAHIIGHSMGGKTAMQFAIQNPDRVGKLIVVDIAPKDYLPGHDAIFKALLAVPIDEVQSRNEVEEIISKWIPEKGIRLFLMKNLDRVGQQNQFEWKMNLKGIWANYDNIRKDITAGVFTGDTLFLKGEKSPYIQDEDEVRIKQYFPKASIKTVPNAGHWVHADSPRAFMENIFEFI